MKIQGDLIHKLITFIEDMWFFLFSLLIFTKKNVQLMASIIILQITIKFSQQNFLRDAGKTY